jgi:transcriptional regulator with XRE-family HTH domain
MVTPATIAGVTRNNGRMISGAQIRAARALLGWSVSDLARRAGVRVFTIADTESTEAITNPRRPGVSAIQATLEAAGIVFTSGDAPGVRLHLTKRRGK